MAPMSLNPVCNVSGCVGYGCESLDGKTLNVVHDTYQGRPLVPSVRDGGCSGMSLAYDLLETIAVLESGCTRGRSRAREAEFMVLSLMIGMIGYKMSHSWIWFRV